jgi:hypothetical protein
MSSLPGKWSQMSVDTDSHGLETQYDYENARNAGPKEESRVSVTRCCADESSVVARHIEFEISSY